MSIIVTTTNEVAGYRITRHLGVVRGLTVRSRSVIGNIGAGIQSLFGGNITIYTELAEKAREEAFNLMVADSGEGGQAFHLKADSESGRWRTAFR